MRFTTLATAACGIALSASIALGAGGSLAQGANSLPASLISGSCAQPGTEVSALRAVTPNSGDVRGSESALVVWESHTEVRITLSEVLASPHAILIGEPASPLACGDIGGAVDDDGDVAIGLQALENSGYFGVADLEGDDEDDDDDDELEIRLYVVQPIS